ncbi:MAG: long-chain fatty acid--CoA ligase [Spirochaetales bacterium]|nr:long-chain fatty acid--CoA ligase [Spirochaetales bacterium]
MPVAVNGVEMKIVGEEGQDLPDGEEGEIIIRSTTIFRGCWNNPEATAAVLKPDDMFFITNRKKDIIISHGENISPREVEEVVEEVLATHPKVSEAAVVNVPSLKGDELVTTYGVPKTAGSTEGSAGSADAPTLRELTEFCELHLAPYKRLIDRKA